MPTDQRSGHVPHRVEIITADHVTVAVVLPKMLPAAVDGKMHLPIGFGVSRCHPSDEYNYQHGVNLATARAIASFGEAMQESEQARIDQDCQRHSAIEKMVDALMDYQEFTDTHAPLKPSEKPPEERSPLDLLIVGREMIQDPKWWVKGTTWRSLARRIEDGEDAVCPGMCATGAVWAASGGFDPSTGSTSWGTEVTPGYRTARRFLDRAVMHLSKRRFTSTTSFNDDLNTKHSDIMALFNTAIAMAKAESS